MSSLYKKYSIQIVGIALEGQQGSPVIVFDNPANGDFLTIPANPFDAEILIRDFVSESGYSATTWLGDFLAISPPHHGIIKEDDNGDFLLVLEFGILSIMGLRKNRVLPIGEGLTLIRRFSVPLYADEKMFDASREEITFLTKSKAFGGDFLYLTPPQYAPNIPVA